jgi:hypothetical protein
MMKMIVGRWPEILRPLFLLCRQFVGQPSQQSSEWTCITSKIVFVLVEDFAQGVDLGNLHLVRVGVIFRNLWLILEWLVELAVALEIYLGLYPSLISLTVESVLCQYLMSIWSLERCLR